MNRRRILIIAKDHPQCSELKRFASVCDGPSSLPCEQGRAGVGCERSERQEGDVTARTMQATFGDTLKHRQPHPNPSPACRGGSRSSHSYRYLPPVGQTAAYGNTNSFP
jgi:hypothetical protein